jgi:hypothetical protein
MWSTLPFCLEQSLRGHHHLFEATLVRESFGAPLELDARCLAVASQLMESLRSNEALEAQRRSIQGAPPVVQRLFVRLYFDFLEGWARDHAPTLH